MELCPPSNRNVTRALLVALGLFLIASTSLVPTRIYTNLLSINLDSVEPIQIGYMRIGLLSVGLMALFWGGYEILLNRPGPLVLVSTLCLLPMLIPFGGLGFGADPSAWRVSFAVLNAHAGGESLINRAGGSPLFDLLAILLVPGMGWPGLFTANLIAGIAGVLVWSLLPLKGESVSRIPLLAVSILTHPLYLLAMTTGLDFIWQTLFLSLSMVLLVRSIDDERQVGRGLLFISAISFGIACGFQIASLAVLPVFVGVLFFGTSRLGSALKVSLSFSIIAILTALLCGLPILMNSGEQILSVPPHAGSSNSHANDLLSFVLPIPFFALVAAGFLSWVPKWKELDRTIRLLIIASLGVILIVIPGFLYLPEGPSHFALCVPFLVVLYVFTLPRSFVALLIPVIAAGGVISIPILAPGPDRSLEVRFRPVAGPLLEEVNTRFQNLRRVQQLMLITPQEKTAVVVGFDWPTLATLHPNWEKEEGVLENPDFPVRFYDWIDLETFESLVSEGRQILIVEGIEEMTQTRFGFAPSEKGAIHWDPRKRYYR